MRIHITALIEALDLGVQAQTIVYSEIIINNSKIKLKKNPQNGELVPSKSKHQILPHVEKINIISPSSYTVCRCTADSEGS